MKNEKKVILSEEHLRKIKYRFDYSINESPRYRPLVGDSEVFDEIPMLTNEAGEQEDMPKPEGEMPTEPTNDQPVGMDTPAPSTGDTNANISADTSQNDMGIGMDADMGAEMGAPDAGQEVDVIQNDIIKHNIEAMRSIHDKLEGLDATVQKLNSKLDTLNADVEEVREPTNTEKLMSKTNVSYPYYFNLNDFWSGNWFNEKRKSENEKGVRELPDGSYIADFDDLPQKSKIDAQNSFNDY